MKMRCRRCVFLDWEFISNTIEPREDGTHYCGLHGGTTVDIDGPQMNLDNRGSCGFADRIRPAEQLDLWNN